MIVRAICPAGADVRAAAAAGPAAALRAGVCAALCLVAWGAQAQSRVQPTNDIGRCTLITDPTAQRACIESTVTARPAPSFDPTVRKPVAAQLPRNDRKAPIAKPAPPATPEGGPPSPAKAQADQEAYQQQHWRLQIP